MIAPYGWKERMSLSKAEHVKFCLKMGGPPSKPKYSSTTDSEQVPRGKGHKHPDEGSERDLKPNAYKQSKPLFGGVTAYLLYNGSAT